MTKSNRMFEIIQLLRQARAPVKAQWLADELEVSKRTIYRDIAALQMMRTPIEGEAGIGYVLRKGYDLPPLNFDVDEAEAITVGLAMVARTGDLALKGAALRAARKMSEAAPAADYLYSTNWGAQLPGNIDAAAIRRAIRDEMKITISYRSDRGEETVRTLCPLALIYYVEVVVLAGWCELRQDFRHFRLDRIGNLEFSKTSFAGKGKRLREEWQKSASFDPYNFQS